MWKEMLTSSNKQVKVLASENSRFRKKWERYEARLSKQTVKKVNCSREVKNIQELNNKRSHRNLHDFSGIKNGHYILPSQELEQESPSFRHHTSESKNKIKKSVNTRGMDQIVIINNHEYLDKLQAPTYKARKGDKSKSSKKSLKNIEAKNSKSEERIKNQYINIEEGKDEK